MVFFRAAKAYLSWFCACEEQITYTNMAHCLNSAVIFSALQIIPRLQSNM